MMDVSVDVGFDLRTLHQLLPERLRVFQSAGEVQWIAAETRIVMGKKQRGFVCMFIQ